MISTTSLSPTPISHNVSPTWDLRYKHYFPNQLFLYNIVKLSSINFICTFERDPFESQVNAISSSVQTKRAPALDQSSIRLAEEKTEKFLSKIRTHLDDDSIRRGQMWILGTDEPTILDAHTIPFLSRVTDVGRGQILGSSLTRYMENVLKSELWTRVMQDRCTVYKRYL